MIIPNPENITWDLWAATVVGYNPGLENHLHPNMAWRNFASFFVDDVPQAPLPDGHDDWREWARALKLAVQS